MGADQGLREHLQRGMPVVRSARSGVQAVGEFRQLRGCHECSNGFNNGAGCVVNAFDGFLPDFGDRFTGGAAG